MSLIDPCGLFGTFQRVQEPYAHENDEQPPTAKSQMTQVRNALFGSAPLTSAEESSLSEASNSAPQTTADYLAAPFAPGQLQEPSALFGDDTLGLGLDLFLSPEPEPEPEPYELSILGIPESGARSRTETQIKLVLRLVPRAGAAPVKWLSLPRHQMSCSRLGAPAEDAAASDERETLKVRVRVVRSDSEEPVYACYACILRERRRMLRKRAKSEAPEPPSDSEEDEFPVGSINKETEQDRERILVFPSQSDRVQMLRGDVMVPIRLTCYCRHHDEKIGFRIKIELLDLNHQLAASNYSPPILITDDHKRVPRQSKTTAAPQSFPSPSPSPSHASEAPKILKVVPAEGPMHGGIEVTVLGENLCARSVVIFGALPAPVISCVGASTAVVRLPPSLVPGIVAVSVSAPGKDARSTAADEGREEGGGGGPEALVLFNYKNDLDRAMMELALQLIGMKMTGRVDDARDIALRIISEFSSGSSSQPTPSPASASQHSSFDRIEQALITCLAAAEATGGIRFTTEDLARFRTVGGQTLLHLAALARCDHLFEYLGGLGQGELLGSVDHNGFTPADLHYLAGRQEFLETLGLDDGESEEDCPAELDLFSRFKIVCNRARLRNLRVPSTVWDFFASSLARLRKRPSRARNYINRIRNSLWRKISSESTIKTYYLQTFGTKAKAIDAGNRIYQNYRDAAPFRKRARDLMLWYFWVPILVAIFVVWCFDLGSNVSSVVSWTIMSPPPAEVLAQ